MAPRDIVFGVQILFLVVDTIVISLRLFVRTRLNRAIGYDDYTLVVAMVSPSRRTVVWMDPGGVG